MSLQRRFDQPTSAEKVSKIPSDLLEKIKNYLSTTTFDSGHVVSSMVLSANVNNESRLSAYVNNELSLSSYVNNEFQKKRLIE